MKMLMILSLLYNKDLRSIRSISSQRRSSFTNLRWKALTSALSCVSCVWGRGGGERAEIILTAKDSRGSGQVTVEVAGMVHKGKKEHLRL